MNKQVVVKILEHLGVKEQVKTLYHFNYLKKKKILYYSQRHKSHKERNRFIQEGIQKRGSWVLDVGANTGETSNFLAKQGHYVLGVEVGKGEAKVASQKAESGAAFMNIEIDESFMQSMPQWDVILFMSVAHRIYAIHGEQRMRDILRLGSKKTNEIFFEGATNHKRYTDQGQPEPDFTDLDVQSCDNWHRNLFRDSLGKNWQVLEMKVLPQSHIEPFRISYHLRKKNHF